MGDGRTNLAAIAAAAGVSRMTVSRALRNAPYVDALKRKRILAIAERLGYRPDPRVAAFMDYLRSGRPAERAETLAYVFCRPGRSAERRSLSQNRFLDGIVSRAERLGFALDRFELGPGILSPRRLAQILLARGIRGAIVANLSALTVPIGPLLPGIACCVAGRVLPELPVHRASSSHYTSIRVALAHLSAKGRRRIGLLLNARTDAHLQHAWRAALLDFLWQYEVGDQRLVHIVPEWNRDEVLDWIRSTAPQTILTQHEPAWGWLREADLAGRVELVLLDRPPGPHALSGIDQQHEAIGASAVDLIAAQLLNHDLGPPQHPRVVTVTGTWVEGDGRGRGGV